MVLAMEQSGSLLLRKLFYWLKLDMFVWESVVHTHVVSEDVRQAACFLVVENKLLSPIVYAQQGYQNQPQMMNQQLYVQNQIFN